MMQAHCPHVFAVYRVLHAPQLLQEFAGSGDLLPTSHTRQRMSMLLRLPLGTEHFLGKLSQQMMMMMLL
jgi:hypothetical protein